MASGLGWHANPYRAARSGLDLQDQLSSQGGSKGTVWAGLWFCGPRPRLEPAYIQHMSITKKFGPAYELAQAQDRGPEAKNRKKIL